MVTQNICQYRSLQYSRQEGTDGGLPEEVLFGASCCPAAFQGGRAGPAALSSGDPFLKPASWPLPGNLDLLPPSGKSAKPGAAPTEHKGLVSHNGSLINVGNLLQRAEQQDSGRLYLENKIHTLELKLGEWPVAAGARPDGARTRVCLETERDPAPHASGLLPWAAMLNSAAVFLPFPPPEESHNRFSATEATNKTLAAEMQELRGRLAEAEEAARAAERQRNQLQRLLQEFRRRLTPLQLEVQRMVEKVGLPPHARPGSPRRQPGLPAGSVAGPPVLALPPRVLILVLGGQLGREGGGST